jgi:predicted PurR-regulated permease PerM
MTDEKRIKKILAFGLFGLISVFLAYALWPYVEAFFGAFIFFMLFHPLFDVLVEKLKWKPSISAIIVILISLLIIIIPLSFLVNTAIDQVIGVFQQRNHISTLIQELDNSFPSINFMDRLNQQISTIIEFMKNLFLSALTGFTNVVIGLIILYFLLYYLLIGHDDVKDRFVEILPFNKKNARKLFDEFKNITHSTIISTGLISIFQGLLIGLGFWFFHIPGAILWGIIAAILSFLPVLGTPIVWIPTSLVYLAQKNYYVGIGILIWGIIVSTVDNFIRPYLQNKVGKIHPLITLIGIFVGIPFFGLFGIIIGPLLLSYFLLILEMINEEYL